MINRTARNFGCGKLLGLCLGLGLISGQALAEDKAGAPIVLPGKQPAASAPVAAKPEAASAAVTHKIITLPSKLVASMAAGKAKAKEPETMAPGVKQSPAPEIKPPVGPSPEVHAPGEPAHGKPASQAAKRKKPLPAKGSKKPQPAQSVYASQLVQIHQQLSHILTASRRHFNGEDRGYFRALADAKAPHATVVTCSDSKVATDIPAKGAVDGLYLVRDFGNQLQPMVGTIEYGVRQLHTPVLIFVSHAACASIKAAAGEEEPTSTDMAQAVHGMGLPPGIDTTNGALLNINNQVESAILTFSGEVEAGRLAILGGYFDFRNDLKRGPGKLVITNLNGETEPARIHRMMQQGQYFKYSFMH